MKDLRTLTFLLFLLLFAACKKEEIKRLPPATMTGANTMGALVNGKAWVADGGVGFQPPKPVEGGYQGNYSYDETTNNVYIRFNRKDKTKIQLYLRNVSKPGEYLLNTTTTLFGGGMGQPENYGVYIIPGKVYMTNSSYTGKVIVTRADTINKVVSGVFEFNSVHGGETVTVTHGRFDVSPL